MLSAALLLVCQSLFWQLHLAGEGGSFPKPLTAEEEKKYLERCVQGIWTPAMFWWSGTSGS